MNPKRCNAVLSFLILTFMVPSIFAQSMTLRDIEPIIMQGSAFPLFSGEPIDSLFLYAYRADSEMFEQIPFQFNERGSDGSFFTDDDGFLDDNDELAFMFADAGDRAPIDPGPWIDNPESQLFPRYEIEITDPMGSSNTRWAYLYRSSSLNYQPETDYVEYISPPAEFPAADTVVGRTYKIGSQNTGFFSFLSFPQVSNNNIFDRQKIRVIAEVFLVGELKISEEEFAFVGIEAIDGPVRVIKGLTISLLGAIDATLPIQFFPNSVELGGSLNIPPDIEPIPGLSAKIVLLRHSFDLSPMADGMQFFSNKNPSAITIDGSMNPDASIINTEIDTIPEVNWLFFTGAQGTLVNLISISAIGDNRELYYLDDNSTDPDDTGDLMSYGDTGILVTGADIEGEFPLGLKSIFLDPNQPSSVGSQLAEFEKMPLSVTQTSQTFGEVVSVELASFTANVEKNNIQLIWFTAKEIDNFGFDLERRVHGTVEWTKIAFIAGNKTSEGLKRYEYFDRNLQPGSYEYRLKQINSNGSFQYFGTIKVFVGLPNSFALHQNFPNPFNPSTVIQYQLPTGRGEAAGKNRTILKIYNLLGEEVRTLVDEEQAPGYYEVSWDGIDNFGRRVSTGVYIYQLKSGKFVNTKKMVLVQ